MSQGQTALPDVLFSIQPIRCLISSMREHDQTNVLYHQTAMRHTPTAKTWDPTVFEAVSPNDAAFVYDIDLDALTVHFRGRSYPSVVDPINQDVAQPLDLRSREVVGIELREFRSNWLQVQPSLVAVLHVATIVGLEDEEIEDAIDGDESGLLRPVVDWWRECRQLPAKRAALHVLSATSAR